MNELEELTSRVIKREAEEWEYLQRIIKAFGRNDASTSTALARWSQWNDFKYMLKQINNK